MKQTHEDPPLSVVFLDVFLSMCLVFLNQSAMDLQQKSRQIELPEFSKSRFARRANMMDEAKSDDATLGGNKSQLKLPSCYSKIHVNIDT